jgi:Tol biopolymer transport system component
MTQDRSIERISAWLLEEAPDQLPDRVLRATFERTRTTHQRRSFLTPAWLRSVIRSRQLVFVLALLALLLAGLAVIGSQRVPQPLGITRNGLIAYDADWHIYTQGADGSNRIQLTDGTEDFWPAWSPDASKLAFYRNRVPGAVEQGIGLWVVNADGSGVVDVSAGMAIMIEDGWRFAWAPTSDLLAFASGSPFASAIYVARADGSALKQIVDDTLVAAAPAWSPDGSTVAFRAGRYDKDSGIYLINPDGSDLRRLTAQPHIFDRFARPAWSPDGTNLVFFAGSPGGQDIWTIRSDGSDEHRLMETAYPIVEIWPVWSPDGSRIAFVRLDLSASSGTVVVMQADGSGAHAISAPSADGPVEWSPDGTRVIARICPTTEPDCEDDDIWDIVALDPAAVEPPEVVGSVRGLGILGWQRLPP